MEEGYISFSFHRHYQNVSLPYLESENNENFNVYNSRNIINGSKAKAWHEDTTYPAKLWGTEAELRCKAAFLENNFQV
jgi:hypothetical protein